MVDLGEPVPPKDVRIVGEGPDEIFEMSDFLIYLGVNHDMHVYGLEVNQTWYDLLMDAKAKLEVGVLPPHTGVAIRPFPPAP